MNRTFFQLQISTHEFLRLALSDVPAEILTAVAGVIDNIPPRWQKEFPLSVFTFVPITNEDDETIGVTAFFNNKISSGQLSFENNVYLTVSTLDFSHPMKISEFNWDNYMTPQSFCKYIKIK